MLKISVTDKVSLSVVMCEKLNLVPLEWYRHVVVLQMAQQMYAFRR